MLPGRLASGCQSSGRYQIQCGVRGIWCIKVCDLEGNALYFSREPIPTRCKALSIPMGKQVCIIPFRRDFLLRYTEMAPTPLEIAESVDMMRILEHGLKVRMVPTRHNSRAVDTPR